VRESLPALIKEFVLAVQAFPWAEQFPACDCIARTGCLILNIAMLGMFGPDLQQELIRREHETPIIFVTTHGDVTD